jgi:hypothetical protein
MGFFQQGFDSLKLKFFENRDDKKMLLFRWGVDYEHG